QELSNAVCIRGVRSCVARGVNSGSASKGRHHKTRIVRNHELRRELAIMKRLAGAVFSKGRRRFFKRRQIGEIWKEIEFDPAFACELAVLAELAWVGGRQE